MSGRPPGRPAESEDKNEGVGEEKGGEESEGVVGRERRWGEEDYWANGQSKLPRGMARLL